LTLSGTLLAIAGMGWLLVKNLRFGVIVAAWFIPAWGIFVLFYAGGYHYGASSRYAVISAAPVALLVGVGGASLWQSLRRDRLLIIGVCVLASMNWITSLTFVPHLGRESNQGRADVDFVRDMAPTLPRGSLVIAMNPCLWLLRDRNSGHLGVLEPILRSGLHNLKNQYPGGIYLHWDYWLSAQPNFASAWQQILVDTKAELVVRRTCEESEFALFKLDTPYALKTLGGEKPIGKNWTDLDAVLQGVDQGIPAEIPPEFSPTLPPADHSTNNP
jgi:hypothetical protein